MVDRTGTGCGSFLSCGHDVNFYSFPPTFFFLPHKANSIIFKWTCPGDRLLCLILHQLGKSFNSSVLVFKRKFIIVPTP